MKLVTTAGLLRSALTVVSRAVARRSTHPVLECVLFDGPTIRGTNLDMEIVVTLAVTVAEGRAAIALSPLRSLVSAIRPDETVTIEANGGPAAIRFGTSRYELPALGTDDFPAPMSDKVKGDAIEVPGLKEALRFVAPVMSWDWARYYLEGFCFSADGDGRHVLVATDGHRMAVRPLGFDAASLDGCIVPNFAASALLAMPEPKSIRRSGTWMTFRWDGLSLTTKLIDGTFPDWRRVLPKRDADSPSVSIDRAETAAALKRLFSITGKSRNGVALVFADGRAAIAAKAIDHGEGVEYLQATSTGAKPGALYFNGRFATELLAMFRGSERVNLTAGDAQSPIRLDAGAGAFALLMPVRQDADDLVAAITAELKVPAARAA